VDVFRTLVTRQSLIQKEANQLYCRLCDLRCPNRDFLRKRLLADIHKARISTPIVNKNLAATPYPYSDPRNYFKPCGYTYALYDAFRHHSIVMHSFRPPYRKRPVKDAL
jgi:hypothetical protein